MSEHSNIPSSVHTTPENAQAYWRANVRLIIGCLIVWTLCSHGFAIFLRPALMGIHFMGVDIGLWFGQQGAILTFVAIIFFYSWRMNALDKKFGVAED